MPAISAGAAKRKTCQKGKFHGMTASTDAERVEADVAASPRRSRAAASARKRLGVLGVVVAGRRRTSRPRPPPARSACPSRASSCGRARPGARGAGGRRRACAPTRSAKGRARHVEEGGVALRQDALELRRVTSPGSVSRTSPVAGLMRLDRHDASLPSGSPAWGCAPAVRRRSSPRARRAMPRRRGAASARARAASTCAMVGA